MTVQPVEIACGQVERESSVRLSEMEKKQKEIQSRVKPFKWKCTNCGGINVGIMIDGTFAANSVCVHCNNLAVILDAAKVFAQ